MTNDGNTKVRKNIESVVQILNFRAQHTPDKTAYGMLDAAFNLSEITYSELFLRVSALSSSLSALKIAEGNRCILMFHQGIDFIVSFLACNRIGAIPVPINMPGRNKSLAKWENISMNSQARCIITDKTGVFSLKDMLKNSETLSALPVYSEQEDVFAETISGFNELAFLQYTSGSTGDPKGVMVTHSALMNNLKQIKDKFRFHEDSVMVSWLPFYHDMGLILGILQGIYSGYKVILMNPADFMQQPMNWMKAISVYGATHTTAPNFAYELAADKLEKLTYAEAGSISLKSLERAICGAEPVNMNTLLKFNKTAQHFGLREYTLSPGYGLAEASLVVSAYKAGQEAGWLKLNRKDLQSGSISVIDKGYLGFSQQMTDEAAIGETYLVGNGFVVDEHQLSIRNPEDGTELSAQAIGEICFAGPSVTKGYWNRPEETKNTFPADEKNGQVYLRTGDLGFKDTNGELYITSRIKDLIIIRGMNYYPQDIERTAFNAGSDLRIDGAAAFSVPQEGEEKLILIQEVNRSAVRNPQCDKWAKIIREDVLKVHGIPAEIIIFIPPMHIPRTTSGKIQRNKAKLMYLNCEWSKIVGTSSLDKIRSSFSVSSEKINSREALAEFIAGLVARQLAITTAEIDQNIPFAELGINSMMSLSIRNSLEQAMGFIVPAASLFNYNTVQQMSEHLYSLCNISFNKPVQAKKAADHTVFAQSEFDNFSEDELFELLKKELGETDHAY
ncbi:MULTISPECIES: AMP-binding protein [Pelosinus]|uniref:AMP-dependent synthetase and ligase n=1 Tax=Pelosinus fermentans B4 TaxID=1149862 RepID=I8RFD4_9FIRM|nr:MULTISPECIES: AMP-binding protein [Pelosinus]EIW16350.1 AMP-dependent synthetase and ligase [Pelosinus fermentans B4]EIW22670.1 AMP-dependent synthetase and ligase [Pelosinus fermentans A11]OAM95657.1 Long-chain-fatty-acid--CoA ligase [Pelosinus fermentans DSM 17108]SDR31172.1 Acyl-CoA synthetase (AMP-forming)/AMP-acid ligase II [Pelosinus fermentans]